MPLNKNYWGSLLHQVQIGVIAVLTILGILISDWIYRDTKDKLFTELSNSALLLDRYFKQSFYHRELSVSSIGYRLLDIKGPNQDSLRLRSAKRFLTYYNELIAFGLSDVDGKIKTFTGQVDGVDPPDLMGSEKSRRSFLLTKEEYEMVLGEVYYFDAIKDWVLPIRVPMLDKNLKLIAFNTSSISYKVMLETLENFNFHHGFRVHLINNNFNTTQIYFPLDSTLYRTWLGKDASVYKDTLYANTIGELTYFKAKNIIENTEVLGVRTKNSSLNHYLVISVSEDELKSMFYNRVGYVAIIYLVLLLITILGFYYLKQKDAKHFNAISKERQYSKNIILGSPAMIVGISNDGICNFANPATLIATQFNKEEIIGKNWWRMLYPKDYYDQVRKLFEAVKEGEVKDYEMTMLRKDGEERVVSWNSLSFINNAGEIYEIVGFGHDVTELKKAQLELKKYTENLELLVKERTEELTHTNNSLTASNFQLNEQHKVLKETLENLESTQKQLFQADKMASLGVLLAGVGHEINNPLNFINGGIQGLKTLSTEIDEKAKPFYEIIEEGVRRASNIVKSLSHFSRKTGKMNEQCDVQLIIDNCLTILHNKLKHTIEVEKDYKVSDFIIIGSEGKLHQAILNVLSNAEQAITNQGKISIHTYQDEKHIYLSIRDSGEGISEENILKIGDPFFTTKEVGEGTGLGLSITYSIMEEHGGRIEVNSKIGEGTEFILTFPV